MAINHQKEAQRALADVRQILNEDVFADPKRIAYESLLDALFKEAGPHFTIRSGNQLEIGLVRVFFDVRDNGLSGTWKVTGLKERTYVRADVEYDPIDDKLYGPLDESVVPTPGEYFPRKDPLVVACELLKLLVVEAAKEIVKARQQQNG